MSDQMRARVQKCIVHRDSWIAAVWVGDLAGSRIQCARSWPEAMQAAYVLRRDLDQQLMDEVHESRASRRTPRPEPTTAGAPE